MNIVVCVKQVPDTWSEKKLDPSDSTLDRAATDPVMNEMDEYAVEEALTHPGGPGRRGHDPLHGPRRGDRDGAQGAVDGRRQGGARHRRRAARLRRGRHLAARSPRPSSTSATSTSCCSAPSPPTRGCASCRRCSPSASAAAADLRQGGHGRRRLRCRIKRLTDDGYTVVEASLPAVVSVVEKINEPRYPSFKGIMAAKKKPVETLVARRPRHRRRRRRPGRRVEQPSSRSRPRRRGRPAPSSRTRAATAADKLAEFLASKKFV